MSEQKRIIPQLTKDGFLASSCSVCDIDDIIGTNEDLCTVHFSDPKVEYYYAYDYITVKKNRCRYGYYIGMDRFYPLENGWGKEYVLYEYAIYCEKEEKYANRLLFRHLLELAKTTGCNRILCKTEGGNALFYKYFTKKGFTENGAIYSLPIPDGKMSRRDQLVIPTKEDALSFEQLFFLREQGFTLEEEKCFFARQEEYISIDRKTGKCTFSKAFQVLGGESLVLNNHHALCILDVCCQLLKDRIGKQIKIYLPSAKTTETTPDISADDIGIFLTEQATSLQEQRNFRLKLKEEGLLKKYALYSFYFNFEIGGACHTLGFRNI